MPYNYFRNYRPTQGHFSQADPIGIDVGANRFGYADGLPLTIEAAGPVTLLLKTAITNLTQSVEKHGSGQRIPRLTLV